MASSSDLTAPFSERIISALGLPRASCLMSASRLRHSCPPSIMSATKPQPAILTRVLTTAIDRLATSRFVLMRIVYMSHVVAVTSRLGTRCGAGSSTSGPTRLSVWRLVSAPFWACAARKSRNASAHAALTATAQASWMRSSTTSSPTTSLPDAPAPSCSRARRPTICWLVVVRWGRAPDMKLKNQLTSVPTCDLKPTM